MADVEVIDLTDLADDDVPVRPLKRQRREKVIRTKTEDQQDGPNGGQTGPILPDAETIDLTADGRTVGAKSYLVQPKTNGGGAESKEAGPSAPFQAQAGPAPTPAQPGAGFSPFAAAAGEASPPRATPKQKARGGQAPPGPKSAQAAATAATLHRLNTGGPGPSTPATGTPRPMRQLTILGFTTPGRAPGSGSGQAEPARTPAPAEPARTPAGAHASPTQPAEQQQQQPHPRSNGRAEMEAAEAPAAAPPPPALRRQRDHEQPEHEPQAGARPRHLQQQQAKPQEPISPHPPQPQPHQQQHHHHHHHHQPQQHHHQDQSQRAAELQPPTQPRPQPPTPPAPHQQPIPQPSRPPRRPPQPQPQPQTEAQPQPQPQPERQPQAQQRAGDRPTPQDRLERQVTLQRLADQEQKLAAQREALAGVDLASSLRFLNVVTAHNETLMHIKQAFVANIDAGQHAVLSDLALQSSTRLERLGAKTAMDLVNALLAMYGKEPEEGGAGAGPSGSDGRGGARGEHDDDAAGEGRPMRLMEWRRLGQDVARFFHPARGPSVLLGPMEAPQKPRRQAAQRQKPEPVAPVTRPKEYTGAQADSGQVDSFTSHIMEDMVVRMRNLRPAPGSPDAARDLVVLPNGVQLPAAAFRPLVEIVLDPAGFAQTVENLHALGHLLAQEWLMVRLNERDQLTLAALSIEDHNALRRARARGAPQVRHEAAAGGSASAAAAGPSNPGAGRNAGAGAGGSSQAQALQRPVHFFVPIEMADWRRMCREVPPDRCLMASRVYQDDEDVGARWDEAAAGGAAVEAGAGAGGSGAGGSGAGEAGGSGAGGSGAGEAGGSGAGGSGARAGRHKGGR